MAFAKVNGIELYYEEYSREEHRGQEPLILLHGLTGNIEMYRNEIEKLKDRYHIVAIDSRGHGKSEKASSYTLFDHIEDVLALLDYLNMDTVNIMGISMGSYIAQGIAIKAPERVNKLILVSSKSNGKTSSMARLFKEHADEIVGLEYMEQINALSKYIFHNLEAVGKSMQETSSIQLTADQQLAANKALEGFDFRNSLNKVTAQTLVISGKFDGLNPPDEGKIISELIPQAEFIVFNHSGHSPNIEEESLFMKTIETFLE